MFGLKVWLKSIGRAFGLAPSPAHPPVIVARPPARPPTPTPPTGPDSFDLLAAANVARYGLGLGTLLHDRRLADAAGRIALDNAAARHLSHVGTDGSTPASRVADAGFRGESSECGFAAPAWAGGPPGWGSAEAAVDAWLHSTDGHREILLGPWTAMGGARAVAPDGMIYWFADFGSES